MLVLLDAGAAQHGREDTDASSVRGIFFPDAAMPCRASYVISAARKRCTFAHEKTSLVKLIRELHGAAEPSRMVFTITCNEIADAIENAAQRGVPCASSRTMIR